MVGVLFWTIIFSFKWADGRLEAHASKTGALLYQLNSEIQNLPEPSTIKAGKTSGNAAGVLTKYQRTIDDLREADKMIQPPALPNFLIFWKRGDMARIKTEASIALNGAADDLQRVTDALKTAKKFIEYAPLADLGGIGKEEDSAERLDRTKEGMLQTAKELREIDFEHAQAMAGLIPPLAQQVPGLKEATLPAWSAAVLKSQSEQVAILQKYWPSYVKGADGLLRNVAGTAASYQ